MGQGGSVRLGCLPKLCRKNMRLGRPPTPPAEAALSPGRPRHKSRGTISGADRGADDAIDGPSSRSFNTPQGGQEASAPKKPRESREEPRPGGVEDVLDEVQPHLYQLRPAVRSGDASPETDGNPSEPVNLAMEPSEPESPWVDSETGSRWSIVGRAVSGPRKGKTLRWLPGVMVKWYAWSAEYPKTSLESADRFRRRLIRSDVETPS